MFPPSSIPLRNLTVREISFKIRKADQVIKAHTSRATALFARSPTYVHDQLLHPAFRAVCEHFLVTEASTGEGEEKYTLRADPLLSSAVAFRIDPGARAQELHRDDVIHHNFSNPAITAWQEPRDLQREASLSMFVAATPSTKANGATRLIPQSHLWDADRRPEEDEAVPAEMQPGDALFMLSSCYHGGSENRTQDETRIVIASTVIRGILRQEENQFLSTPMAVLADYPEEAQRLAGFKTQFPGLGWVDFKDPMERWEEKGNSGKM
ncbi:MAG: hypothetical protein Q9167_000423 [Letrouitia subvulpina]